jgi:hypothetical protein
MGVRHWEIGFLKVRIFYIRFLLYGKKQKPRFGLVNHELRNPEIFCWIRKNNYL